MGLNGGEPWWNGSIWEREAEVNGAGTENEQICSFSITAPFTSTFRSHVEGESRVDREHMRVDGEVSGGDG